MWTDPIATRREFLCRSAFGVGAVALAHRPAADLVADVIARIRRLGVRGDLVGMPGPRLVTVLERTRPVPAAAGAAASVSEQAGGEEGEVAAEHVEGPHGRNKPLTPNPSPTKGRGE